jgi:hypothetical protein
MLTAARRRHVSRTSRLMAARAVALALSCGDGSSGAPRGGGGSTQRLRRRTARIAPLINGVSPDHSAPALSSALSTSWRQAISAPTAATDRGRVQIHCAVSEPSPPNHGGDGVAISCSRGADDSLVLSSLSEAGAIKQPSGQLNRATERRSDPSLGLIKVNGQLLNVAMPSESTPL